MVGKLPLDLEWRMRDDKTSTWHRTVAHKREKAATGHDLTADARSMIAIHHAVTNVSAKPTEIERKSQMIEYSVSRRSTSCADTPADKARRHTGHVSIRWRRRDKGAQGGE